MTAGLHCAHIVTSHKSSAMPQAAQRNTENRSGVQLNAPTCSLKFAPPSTLDMGITMTSELPDDIRLTEGVCSSRAWPETYDQCGISVWPACQ